MFGTVRFLAVLAVATVLGSWIGLGSPRPNELKRSRLERKVDPSQAIEGTKAIDPTAEGTWTPPFEHATPAARSPFPRLNPEASCKRAWLLAEGPYRAPDDKRHSVTLTFDDGPFPETTPSVLRLLEKYGVRATFFVLGRYLDGDSERAVLTREVLADIARRGHLIGNHTKDHELLTRINHTEVLAQIDDGAASIERVTGQRPVLFRPPYGQLDMWGMKLVKDKHLELVLWNIEARDMKESDPDRMVAELVRELEIAGGGIVLLHDIRPSTIPVLSRLLAWLHERRPERDHPEQGGWNIVDLPTFYAETEAAPQPFADRIELEHARALAYKHGGHSRSRRRP